MSSAPAPNLSADQDEAPRSSRFDLRKEKILNAAGAVFNSHGLRDATLAVIATDIGLNLKSLRYYFQRREDLVAAAFMRSIEAHQDLVQDALGEEEAEARIRRFVGAYFDLQASVKRGQRPEFVHFGDVRALTEPHSDVVWAAYGRLFQSIRRLFRTPRLTWDRARLNAATHMLLSQLLWSVVWTSAYAPEDHARVAARFCDILLGGLAPGPVDLRRFSAFPSAPGPACSTAPGPATDRLSQDSFLRTATALINQLGYRGASVDRISAELGVSKGAFYHHNDTRDGLVVACFERTFAAVREAQDAALAAETDGLSRVAAASVSLVTRQMLDNGALLRTSALTAIGPELRARMSGRMARLTLRFADMLNDGMADGSVRVRDVRIAAEMMTAMINSAEELGRWVKTATADNAAGLYVRPLLAGLLADADA